MTVPTPQPFDPLGPLPTGTTLLEASAGTGKTWTIGALVTRFVAEGVVPLPQMLVVTFGRAASQELRERVRLHLLTAERALADPDAARADADSVIRYLADADPATVSGRRARIIRALADFDAATIATTHQFCQQVLIGLGVAGDSEPDVTLAEDLDDLVVEVEQPIGMDEADRDGRPALRGGMLHMRAVGTERLPESLGNDGIVLEDHEAVQFEAGELHSVEKARDPGSVDIAR